MLARKMVRRYATIAAVFSLMLGMILVLGMNARGMHIHWFLQMIVGWVFIFPLTMRARHSAAEGTVRYELALKINSTRCDQHNRYLLYLHFFRACIVASLVSYAFGFNMAFAMVIYWF
jgi:hypothetical protein